MVGAKRPLVTRTLRITVILLLAAALRIPFAQHAGVSAVPPATVSLAVEALAHPIRPFAGAEDPSAPTLPPALLRLFYEGSLLTERAGVEDRYALRSALEKGSAAPTRLARAFWLALDLGLIALVALLAERTIPAKPWRIPTVVPALALAVSPLMINGVVRVEDALVAALAATAGLLLIEGGAGPWRVIFASAATGVACTASPFGIVFAPFFLVRVALLAPENRAVRLLVGALALVIGAILGEPRLVEAPGVVLGRLGGQLGGSRPIGAEPAVLQLAKALSAPAILAALVGLTLLRFGKRPEGRRVLSLAGPVILALAIPAAQSAAPLLVAPLVALLAGIGLSRLPERWPRPAALFAALLVLAGPAAMSVTNVRRAAHGDSREAAAAWIVSNLPKSARIAADLYGPSLPRDRTVFTLPFDARHPEAYAAAYSPGWYDGFDTFVLVGSQEDRYRRETDRFQNQLLFRRYIRTICERAARFDEKEFLGPSIEVWVRRGEPAKDALGELLDRVASMPVEPRFYVALGTSYLRMGRTADARRILEVASHYLPGDADLAVSMGGAYLAENDLMKADEVLREAIHDNPDHAQLRYLLGRVREKRRLFGDAIGEYKMAVRANPAFADAYLGLAYAYAGAGNSDGARRSAQRVVELAPQGELGQAARGLLAELDKRTPALETEPAKP